MFTDAKDIITKSWRNTVQRHKSGRATMFLIRCAAFVPRDSLPPAPPFWQFERQSSLETEEAFARAPMRLSKSNVFGSSNTDANSSTKANL